MKEIWLKPKPLHEQIDEELCRQINIGLVRQPRIVEIIKLFIDNCEGRLRQERGLKEIK